MPNLNHRRSIRLGCHDYSDAGAYFFTICSQNRRCVFGDVVDGEMLLNQAGRLIQTVWATVPGNYPGMTSDAFVVMPNHVHGILVVTVGAIRPVGAIRESPLRRRRMALSLAIGRLKTVSAKHINELRGTPGVPVWQRNYYEHVVRDDGDLDRVRR